VITDFSPEHAKSIIGEVCEWGLAPWCDNIIMALIDHKFEFVSEDNPMQSRHTNYLELLAW